MSPRDFDQNPYTPCEKRVCAYLQEIMPEIGCGEDPVGFLISSHAVISYHLQQLNLSNKKEDKNG